MTAKDVLSTRVNENPLLPMKKVDSGMPLLEVLPRLLDAPGRLLGVMDSGADVGVIDEGSLIEGLGKLIASRDDSSVLTIECRPEQYSASLIAHAVESADAHLVDLLSSASPDGMVRVMLRVRALDPEGAARSLERYGFIVVAMSGDSVSEESRILAERVASLQTLLNV